MLFEDVGIIFQRNFDCDYHKQIISEYKNITNVIFSTWNYCKENFVGVENVMYSELPEYPGHTNVNYQITSTIAGIKHFKKYKYVMKIRSDLFFTKTDLEKLIYLFDDHLLYFPAYHEWNGGYLCEHMMFGQIESMEKIWNIEITNDDLFPERKITNSYSILNCAVGYIFPILYEYNIKCFWTKRNFFLNEYEHDSLFTYKMFTDK